MECDLQRGRCGYVSEALSASCLVPHRHDAAPSGAFSGAATDRSTAPPQWYGPGPWWMWGDGYGWQFWWICPLMMLFMIVVFAAIFFIVRRSWGDSSHRWEPPWRGPALGTADSKRTLCQRRNSEGRVRGKEGCYTLLRTALGIGRPLLETRSAAARCPVMCRFLVSRASPGQAMGQIAVGQIASQVAGSPGDRDAASFLGHDRPPSGHAARLFASPRRG
jgi:hypothetical protein